MARPLRILYPGAWYHVMNRGASHQTIFYNAEHYNLFLDLFGYVHKHFGAEIHAYCLMSNHYHLLIRTTDANLHKIMQYINGVFTQKFNKSNNRDGALLRGRYKSILVEEESYLLNLSRYIHLNPVSAGIVKRPDDYEWSSYCFFTGKRKKPIWMCCDITLGYFNHQTIQYESFVMQGVDEDLQKFFSSERKPAVLGSREFVERIKNNEKMKFEEDSIEEIPQYCDLMKKNAPSISEIINLTNNIFDLSSKKTIKNKHSKFKGYSIRNIAIYLSVIITKKSQKSIAKEFGKVSTGRISQIYKQMTISVERDPELREEVEKLKLKIKFRNFQ